MRQPRPTDVIVMGGGVVGLSLAYGMAKDGACVRVIDGADDDIRAARANFGLVWVQGKGQGQGHLQGHGNGSGFSAYAGWTQRSAESWADFAAGLHTRSGIDVRHEQRGGLSFCIGEEAYAAKRNALARLHNQHQPGDAEVVLLDRQQTQALLPAVRLGDQVMGASYCVQDGQCDPLALMRSLRAACIVLRVDFSVGSQVTDIKRDGSNFIVQTSLDTFSTPRVVIAAGLGGNALGAMVGIDAPIRPQRGQILVSERLQPFLPFAGDTVRQTADGTVMVGATHEEVGLDLSTTADGGAELARHAVDVFPDLAAMRLVRAWAGLRVMTPDGYPLYIESESHPGAALVTCHSGVTLAAVHADVLAPALLAGPLGPMFAPFSAARLDHDRVAQAA